MVIELPTGTEIGLQSSIINLQGITGASIEITEDIEETTNQTISEGASPGMERYVNTISRHLKG